MKDIYGNHIVKGTKLRCVNDVNYGEIYSVKVYCHTLCIIDQKTGINLPLKDFQDETGKLQDFEVIK